MSAPPTPPAAPATNAGAGGPLSPGETDASCRVPLVVLFVGAAAWLLVASVLALIASLKFHSPNFLADCAWLTYGRVHEAAVNARLYGFALQAGFGVALWIIARLGRTRVSQPWLIGLGGKLWNLGMLVGVIAILAGDGTGFEALQMPRYAALILCLGYAMIGLWTLLTLKDRRESGLSSPQWFLLAALLWFPWIFSTANLLLLVWPVRGVTQSILAWWYADNLTLVCLGLMGLAAAFYFIPKLTDRRLHSDYLGLFTFWTLLLFGSWAVVPGAASPVPAWMPALSAGASALLAVPLLAVAVNVRGTLEGKWSRLAADPSLRFIGFGIAAWMLAGAMKIAGAMPGINAVTSFTWFTVAQSQFNSYGFFAMTMFGAIYHIVPRVAGLEWPSPKAVRAHFWCAALGIVLLAVPLAIGGVVQGLKLNDPEIAFMDVAKATLPFLRVSTMGDLLIFVGHLLLVANLFGLLVRYGRIRLVPFCKWATADLKAAEAKP